MLGLVFEVCWLKHFCALRSYPTGDYSNKFLPLTHEYFIKTYLVCLFMIHQFAYTSHSLFFFSFYSLPCQREIRTSHVYIYLYYFSNYRSCYSWAGTPGVGGWAANAGSRKEKVQYLLLFCCHEQVIDSLRVRVPYSCLSTNQVSSLTGAILQGWDIH